MKGRYKSNTSRKTMTNQKRTKLTAKLSSKTIRRRKRAKTSSTSKQPSKSTPYGVDNATANTKYNHSINRRVNILKKYSRRYPIADSAADVGNTASATSSCSSGHPLTGVAGKATPECVLCTMNEEQRQNDLYRRRRSSGRGRRSRKRDFLTRLNRRNQKIQRTADAAAEPRRKSLARKCKPQSEVRDRERQRFTNNQQRKKKNDEKKRRRKKRMNFSVRSRYLELIAGDLDSLSDVSSVASSIVDAVPVTDKGEEPNEAAVVVHPTTPVVVDPSSLRIKQEKPAAVEVFKRSGRLYQRVMMTCPYNLRQFKDGQRGRLREVKQLQLVDYFKKRFVVA